MTLTRHLYVRLSASVFEQLAVGYVGGPGALRQDTLTALSGTLTVGGQL